MNDDLKYLKLAYQQALKAYNHDEVPVGAIIVKDNQIIARAYNQRETKQMVTAHAETLVIEKACKKLNTWRLDDCTLYTTLEPCIMCSGVIIQSRIKKVVYGASDNNNFNHKPELISGVYDEACSNLIKKYFIEKRNKDA